MTSAELPSTEDRLAPRGTALRPASPAGCILRKGFDLLADVDFTLRHLQTD
jgi:hypothetical protein